jgi:serine/threonine protein kinase
VEFFGEDGEYAYLIMPYIRLGSLKDRLERGPMKLAEMVRLVDQISGALDYAHGRGVVHRDIKPANIMIDDHANARLTDFGLARIHDASMSITGSAVIGTPAYISPEQARAEKADHRSDQYSLGIILYQMATGRLPFEDKNPMALLINHLYAPMPPPRTANPRVPVTIEQVILKAAAKNPEHRFASIAEMNEALQAAHAHQLNPKANPAPEIALPPSIDSSHVVMKARPKAKETARPPNWVRMLASALLALLLFFGMPVVASSLPGLLEQASGAVENGQIAGGSLDSNQLTALAGTIESMATDLAEYGEIVPTDQLRTSIAQTMAAAGESNGGGEGTPTPEGTSASILILDPLISGTPTGTLTVTPSHTPGPSPTPTLSPTPSATSTPGPSPTFSNTASPTPSLAATGGPTASATQTPSSTPTATPTSMPTSTRTPTLIPTQTLTPTTPTSVCSSASLNGFSVSGKKVSWTLTNSGSTPIQITGIDVNWPSSNLRLDKVKLDKKTIWDVGDTTPPTTITSGWRGGTREVAAGKDKDLVFEFSVDATPGSSLYSLTVNLNSACDISG